MKQATKRFSSMLVFLLFMVASLAVFFDLVQPAYSDMLQIKAKALGNTAFLTKETKAVNQVQQLVKTYKSNSQAEQAVSMALPLDASLASAVAQVYGLAAEDNMTVQSMGVSLQSPKVAGAEGISAITGEEAANPYGTVSFQLSAAGSYENFKSFLRHLETNVRLFDVEDVSFQQAQSLNGRGVIIPDYFNYTLTVVAYYQIPS